MARASHRSQDQLQWDEDIEDSEPYTGNKGLLKFNYASIFFSIMGAIWDLDIITSNIESIGD